MSKLINESRFFSDVLKFIGNKNMIIEELIENAVRAHAQNCKIELGDSGIITCHNDGDVLVDFTHLLRVADTGYDAQMVSDQKPAGMGVFMMIAASTKATFRSGNKQLSIDCDRFWSEPTYRQEVVELLDNQDLLECDDYVDGFTSEFVCKEGFIESLKDHVFYSVKEMDNIRLSGYRFYNLDIVINGVKVRRDEHDWLISEKGAGDFEGCVIGVSNQGSGELYWHGKHIACKEIAPFTIVVNGCTDCISPTLPDRRSISNSADELAIVHGKLEAIFEERLNTVFLESKGSCGILNYLRCLKGSYQVEHFDFWGEVKVGYIGTSSYIRDVSLAGVRGVYDDSTKLSCNGHEDELELCRLGSGFEKVSLVIGGTKAPKRVLDLYRSEINIEFKSVKGFIDNYIGFSCVTLCESLKIGDDDIEWFIDEGGTAFYTDCVDGDFVQYLWENHCPDCELDTYNADFDSIMNRYNKSIDVSLVWESVREMLGWCKATDITNINLSEKGVEVEMFDGKKHLLKAA
jgi:hypothetical protein